jgi:hypothetical protein
MINPELDLMLLVALIDKAIYNKYIHLIDVKALATESQLIIQGYGLWFTNWEVLDFTKFVPWFFDINRIPESEKVAYKHLFSRLYKINVDDIGPVINGLRYRKCGETILQKLGVLGDLDDRVVSLGAFDSRYLEKLLIRFNKSLEESDTDLYTEDFSEIYAEDTTKRIPSSSLALTNIINGYRSDFFYLVIAGYDGGKTAFCISEAVKAVTENFQPVLFFTNEQSSKIIKQRIVSCMLNKDNIPFDRFNLKVIQNKSLAQKKFKDLGGENIKIINIFGKSIDDLKKYCDTYHPVLIIIDQVDNIIKGKSLDGGARPYNDMYKLIRSELAQVYAPVIGTTQAKNGGKYEVWETTDTGKKYRTYKYDENIDANCAHWSNVDKQANVDVIIGMSVINRDHTLRKLIVDRNKEGYTGEGYTRLLSNSSKFIDIVGE